jgi:integrase
MVEAWKLTLRMSNATKIKVLTVLFGVMERARKRHRLPSNPVREVEKPRNENAQGAEILFYTPEEVMALVRAAESDQDAAIFLTAAFTGLRRGEIVALRWRDVDFPNSVIRVSGSYGEGQLTTPKSGKVRSVPMAPDVAAALARLGQRERWTQAGDLVFPGITGAYCDASALYRRFITAAAGAGLRRLRFDDLRHTFGTTMAAHPRVDMRRLQEWMGHADITTTLRYPSACSTAASWPARSSPATSGGVTAHRMLTDFGARNVRSNPATAPSAAGVRNPAPASKPANRSSGTSPVQPSVPAPAPSQLPGSSPSPV